MVGLSGGELPGQMLWLRLSFLQAGLRSIVGVTVDVVDTLAGNWPLEANNDGGPDEVGVVNIGTLIALLGLGVTAGGTFDGGGIAWLSSLNGSG